MSEGFSQLWTGNTYRLRLGDIEIDSRFRSVHRAGSVHELNQRCFDLLQLFLSEPGVVHSREEIFRRVWPGVVVEDANITTSIWVLRKALGEEAKSWIRTVSKQGYVFDPPAEIEPVLPPEPIRPAEPEPVPVPPPVIAAPPLAARRPVLRRPLFIGIAATALCLLLLGFIRAGSVDRLPAGRIVLVAQPDPALSAEARWPVELMHAWLDWQLRGVSDRVVVDRSEADGADKDELVVLLRVDMPAESRGEWRVQANFHGGSYDSDILRRTAPDDLIDAISQVSHEVLERLVPEALDANAPVLKLDPASASEMVRGLAAQQRRQWQAAASAYRKVLQGSPEFGLARVNLAQCLAELGQSNAAKAELKQAQPWIDKLPVAMKPPLLARALEVNQDYLGAAAAFGALWRNSAGERPDFRLAEITNLRKAGHTRDAELRLTSFQPRYPTQTVTWLLERADMQIASRDIGQALISAENAIEVARSLGWERERAQAVLLRTDALAFSGKPIDEALFDDAAAAFASVGDQLGVLRAQLGKELQRDDNGAAMEVALAALLTEARAAGNVAAEVDALHRAGLYHYRHGAGIAAVTRMQQGLDVAQAAGAGYLERMINIALLRQDYLRGDYAGVDSRVAAISAEPLEGEAATWVGAIVARLRLRRGDYAGALVALQDSEDQLRLGEAPVSAHFASGLACMRGTNFIPLGQLADAHTALDLCLTSKHAFFAASGLIAKANLSLLAGDKESARPLLAQLQQTLGQLRQRPEYWMLGTGTAAAYSRLGDQVAARSLLQPMLPAIVASGYARLEMDARITLAEVALAEQRPDEAEQQTRLAAALRKPDDWNADNRLRTLDIALDYARGRGAQADRKLAELHDEARRRGDVLAELLTHSLAQGSIAQTICADARRNELLTQSGMSGASNSWLLPRTRARDAVVTARKLVLP